MKLKPFELIALAGFGWMAYKTVKNRQQTTDGVGAAAPRYTVRARVVSTQYRNSSMYGNPSYWVTLETEDGRIITGYTSPNASIAYSINNRNLKDNYYNWTYSKGKRGVCFHYNDEY